MKHEWAFCPSCGNKAASVSPMFNGFFKVLNDVFKQFRNEGILEDEPHQSFTINISDIDGTPNVHIKNLSKQDVKQPANLTTSASSLRAPKKQIEEPKTTVREDGDSLFVEVVIPEVKSMADVEIMNFPESVEVRAHCASKTYHTLIQTGRTRTVFRKEFEAGTLYLELT